MQVRAAAIRSEATGIAALVVVAAAGAAFAHLFREASFAMLHLLTGAEDPTDAAGRLAPAITFSLAATAAVVAAVVGHRAARRHGDRLGLTALASTATVEAPSPTLRGTLARASGTWIASFALVPVGRESAILEAGGTIGAKLGQRLSRYRGALTAGGVSAAFAAAYHAPVAAALYVEEHLGVRRRPRAVLYTALGAAVSWLILRNVLHAHPIFPRHSGSLGGAAILGAIALVPATLGAGFFRRVRSRTSVAAAARLPAGARVVGLAAAMATMVAVVPATAGNGMEALRLAGEHPTIAIAAALALGKLAATTGALAAGVPGGAFSPTMAASAGWTLLVLVVLLQAGVPMPAPLWDGMLVAMVVGIAVGLEAPLTAVFAVPEMAGDLALVPLAALAVVAATALDRRLGGRRRGQPAGALYDEDA